MLPSLGTPPSATYRISQPAGACFPLIFLPSNGRLLSPLPPLLGLHYQFLIGKCGWGLVSPEGRGPPSDIVQCSPHRPSPDPPIMGWVFFPMHGGTTSSGWCSPSDDLVNSPVMSPDMLQSPPWPPMSSFNSPQ